ncbi:hypothetical protein, conserved [Leishmania donovani]|uniref:Hikeshi-like C-terminal domain-containing protein n=1 Tax=Leishmania donovani TaxID=5661 RepID=A0A3Q8IBJ8_LEIDO|nr:hypothetical protein, conserved [Leishmania donovani]AYU78353.1 Protein of unknown function (DUF775), putative [Leishmania donovani]TPP49928.1 hypothetical protein CGC21_29470 [Leishmania donovani]CBZ33707.1 hypothetical protein, conserved [Leishmania donovani]
MQWQQAPPGIAAPYTAAPSSTSPPLFGVIIPGYPVQTDISPVDTGRWIVYLGVAPESFVVFLTMSEPLPPGHGIGLFLAREDTMSFQYVGALTQQRASFIVEVPALFLNAAQPIRIVLGLALEREEELKNLGFTHEQPLQQSQAATKVAIAERILEDLYGFVVSYARTITLGGGSGTNDVTSIEPGDYVVMPTSFVDKWRARLQSKITKDNAFWT